MPPTRARKPGLLNRQFGFPGATGKQKNPAFAFVPDQGKNKRRIFWFRKQTNRSFAKRNSLKNSSWSVIRHFSRTDKSAFNRGRKPASLLRLNKFKTLCQFAYITLRISLAGKPGPGKRLHNIAEVLLNHIQTKINNQQ